MAEKINETTYKIKGNANVYVLLGRNHIVIDTSDSEDSKKLKSELEKFISLEDVKTVLLTHMHYDHSANVDLFPNAQIYCSDGEIKNFREFPQDSLSDSEISHVALSKLGYTRELGSEIEGLKVLNLPGHTFGSVGYVDEKNKVIFTGDTYFSEEVIGRTDLPNSAPWKMKESVEKVMEYVKKGYKVCAGHDYE
jgi:glyoxylase-like metal-dependent hydrolase (beta-lactamase superfamily II)